MNNDLGLLVKDIPKSEVELFVKKTKAKTSVKKIVDKISVDYSWVDVLNEAVPYLDTIIRNPRRFIASEEDIVPIEKTKRVSEESIKHLAVHTQLIQDVDEDGLVKPIKLLNVFKEETIDLYENRFIYSLITNLYVFVRNQLTYKEESASNKEERVLNYEANTIYNNHDISINLNLVSKNQEFEHITEEQKADREAKINNIKEILEDFMASRFMKAMAHATPVRSPIRKTNVILKEQNFIKALELWEFLENYQIQKPIKEENEEIDLTNPNFENDFGMTYFLNYNILNELITKEGEITLSEIANLLESISKQAKRYDIDEQDLQKEIIEVIKKATGYKKEQKNRVKNAYDLFLYNHKQRFNKAMMLFK